MYSVNVLKYISLKYSIFHVAYHIKLQLCERLIEAKILTLIYMKCNNIFTI